MSTLRGRVARILHQNEMFHIFSFSVLEFDGRPVRETKVTGNFFGVNLVPGATMEIEGKWHKHPKYGLQFKAQGWAPWAQTASDAQFFLSTCVDVFEHWNLVKLVAQKYGTDTYDKLLETDIHDEFEDKHQEGVRRGAEKWKLLRGTAALSDFLQDNGIGASLVTSIFHHFGMEAAKIIAENPYRLMEVYGVSFYKANQLAIKKGIGRGDPRRVAGGVLWALWDQTRNGHLFVQPGKFSAIMQNLASYNAVAPFSAPDLDQVVLEAITALRDSKSVVVDPDVGVYLPDYYEYERGAAESLSRLLSVPSELDIDFKQFIDSYEKSNSISLSDKQREAIEQLLVNRVLVVTGAPGTGKTTLIRSFVRLFQQLQISHMLMAPTGIAAKRLSAVTETAAQTIHRALKYDGFSWGLDQHEPLEAQAIIVDEVSMVDQEVLYRLLEAVPTSALLVLVGDDAQLPSVGAGNVLRELLACEAVPHVRLEHVFRQAETSDIVLAAHKIRRGESPLDLPEKEDTEFKFLRGSDSKLLAQLVVKMAAKLKGRNANFQVLSPKYDGTLGVDNLNKLIRDELNPDNGQGFVKLPSFTARVGDRLMVIKNSYHLNVYNGDIGKLEAITKDGLVIRIHGVGDYPDTNVTLPKASAGNMLKLAYAVTVHRCQGEEFEIVIMPMVNAYGRMLQKNLFYTAITRARKKVWLLGETDAVLKAVSNDKVVRRNTILRRLVHRSG